MNQPRPDAPSEGWIQTSAEAAGMDEVSTLTTKRPVVRYHDGNVEEKDDVVATEFPLTIYVNETEMATVVCSPDWMEDLVIGFLASEGVVRSIEQIEDMQISRYLGTARVRLRTPVNFNQAFYNKRYIGSCCGKSRQSFYFINDAHTAKRVEDNIHVTSGQVFQLIRWLDAEARVFRLTGGVHIAGLCDIQSGVETTRTDIGRHNALDKLYGYLLRTGQSPIGKVITFSGRLSSEVLLKVAKMGVGVVLAKSAATALAIDTANELNITAVGFIRDDAFNVYSHAWRIVENLASLPSTSSGER